MRDDAVFLIGRDHDVVVQWLAIGVTHQAETLIHSLRGPLYYLSGPLY